MSTTDFFIGLGTGIVVTKLLSRTAIGRPKVRASRLDCTGKGFKCYCNDPDGTPNGGSCCDSGGNCSCCRDYWPGSGAQIVRRSIRTNQAPQKVRSIRSSITV